METPNDGATPTGAAKAEMKTRLNHLPAGKRAELAFVTDVLREGFAQAIANRTQPRFKNGRILKIILFGSYARGDWVEDPVGRYFSDYDLLVVVNHEDLTDLAEFWDKTEQRLLKELASGETLRTQPTLVVHSLDDINEKLRLGRYFFTDILRDGILLHAEPGHPFVNPEPLSAWEAAAAERRERRNPIERRIAELHRSIERVVDAVCDGVATRPMLDRMTAQEAEKVALEAELAALDLDKKPEITVHPRAADHYARMVEQLQSNLAELSNATDADSRDLIASVRGLVEKIEIIPMSPEPGGPVSLTLHGDLARFMEAPVDNFRSSGVRVVAGGGIEPPTCGL